MSSGPITSPMPAPAGAADLPAARGRRATAAARAAASRPAYDLGLVRADFPLLAQSMHGRPIAYLDNAASTQKPRAVLEAIAGCYREYYANVGRGVHWLAQRSTAARERARETVQAFLGAASAQEIVFVRGTTEAINLVAQSYGRDRRTGLAAGDEVLVTALEHHSNLVPWQLLADRIGARIRYVPVRDDGTLDLEKLSSVLTPEIKIFAFTHVSNSLGTINPAIELCRRAREVGALTLIDAAQSIGHMPLNVQELGCDFLAFSGHKMCAPTGIGVLYGRAQVLDAVPPWHGGGEMIVSVTLEKSSFKKPPHRFEAGTPNIAGAIGLAAAIDYLEGIGRDEIFKHDVDLTTYALDRMNELPGLRVIGTAKEHAGVISFVMDAAHPHDLTTFADRYGLAMRGGHHCNQPLMRRFGVAGTTRASFYLYSTRGEIDQMIDILQKAISFFK